MWLKSDQNITYQSVKTEWKMFYYKMKAKTALPQSANALLSKSQL